MSKYHLVKVDDWCAVYRNGSKYFEGHSIPDFVWMELLDSKDEIVWAQDQADELGYFPEYFIDVKPDE